MNILLVSSSSSSQGGGELYLVHLARGLLERGHRVQIWFSDHPRMDGIAGQVPAGCELRRIDYTNTYDRKTRVVGAVLDRKTICRMTREFQEAQPDVIHVNKQNLEDGLDLLRAASATNIPSLTTIHITRRMRDLGAAMGGVRDWWTRRTLESVACRTLAISTRCQRELSEFRRDGSDSFLVLNGVPDPKLADRRQARARFNFDEDDLVIGTLARLEAQKNPLFLLSVLEKLPANCKLLWVGDGTLRERFESEARARGVADRVHMTGWIPAASELLAALDVFVLPSLFEGLPFSLLEACAAGLPIVTNAFEGSDDVIETEKNGIVVATPREEAWLAALSRVITDPGFGARLGAAARLTFESRFNLETMARETERVYETVIRDWS